MQPTSSAQYAAASSGKTPPVEEVRPGIWSIPLAIPHGIATVQSTLCYALVGAETVTLVDPGWDLPENLATITDFLRARGRTTDDIASIIVTHVHVDHAGVAQRLARLPSHAALEVRRTHDSAHHNNLRGQLAYEASRQGVMIDKPSFAEGLMAFREKRAPRFK